MKLSKITKSTEIFLKKHSPKILTGLGISGMAITTVLAVKATPKAIILIREKEDELEATLTPIQTVQTTWKCYIPAAATGIISVMCLIGANSANMKRHAALATAYTLSETALREYQDKVIETIGEKKEKEIRDRVAKDQIDKNPLSKNVVFATEKGETLCYDPISGRYFKSSVDKIKRAENELDRQILSEGMASLNDFYYLIGLPSIHPVGNDLGWDARTGRNEIYFSSQLAEDLTPCLVLNFSVAPSYEYYK